MPYLRLSDGSEVHYRGKRAQTPEDAARMRAFVERVIANLNTENADGPPCCATCGGTGNGAQGGGPCVACDGTGQTRPAGEGTA